MNRQIGVEHTKYVIVFDPLLMGHVIRRMRSGRVRIFNGVDGNYQFGATPLQILGLGTLIRPC